MYGQDRTSIEEQEQSGGADGTLPIPYFEVFPGVCMVLKLNVLCIAFLFFP